MYRWASIYHRFSKHRPWSILLVFLLAGCSHSLDCSMGIWHDDCAAGTRAYEKKQQADAQAAATMAANAASDDAKCKAYNMMPGTPAYEKCRAQIDDQRAQAESNERAGTASRLLGHLPGN